MVVMMMILVVVMMMLVEDVQDALDKDVQRPVGQLRHNGPPVLIRNHPVAGLERWIVQVIVPKNLLDRKKKQTKSRSLGSQISVSRMRNRAVWGGVKGGGVEGGKGVSLFFFFSPPSFFFFQFLLTIVAL